MKSALRTCWRVSGTLGFFRASFVALLALTMPLGVAFAQPPALSTVPVPMPSDLDQFIADMGAARVLGKALFWEMQTGGDGRTACATCHFHAGTDARTRNTIGVRDAQFRGANQTLTPGDFPFHRLVDPADPGSAVVFDTTEVVGGQGVIKRLFQGINIKNNKVNPVDKAQTVPDPVFNVNGVNVRQVTGRNTPTILSAVFNDRQFWDGRANRFFNGVNPFGEFDQSARVWKLVGGTPQQVQIMLANASLASQAVGPPNNNVEMSWDGRTFPELGKKLLLSKPLALQKVHKNDSVLGPLADKKGLKVKNYAVLVRQAFKPEWWDSPSTVDGQFTQMEANFSLFWGLSVNLYEALLVPDQTKFDLSRQGLATLTAEEQEGLDIFVNQGRCTECHSGAEFTGASVAQVGGQLFRLVDVADGEAFIDSGFLNIGARPTNNDLGVGRMDLPVGSISYARRSGNSPLAVDGAMKVPTLRNIELTGPYMHNGGMSTLTQVVEFYARGSDFDNTPNLAANHDGIGKIRGKADRIAAVVAFLKTLTDERVRFEKAPFDHPEIVVPNGHSGFKSGVALDKNVTIPAVGAAGGPALNSFEAILNGAGL